jgi:mono/diheme cytochrome c family protein
MRKALITVLFLVIALGFVRQTALAVADPSGSEELSAAEKRRLFREGAKLWPVYCNTCHNARPGSEKAPYEWDMIMMHMRTLGNIPPQDAKAILEYLKTQ